jgi:hypothetical protein
VAELRALLEKQQQQIEALKQQLDGRSVTPAAAGDPAAPKLDEAAVKKIVADYLSDNPGAGMPSGVQTGYEVGNGFVIRSAPNSRYVNWDDECKIPFELRFRGRLQLDYYNYNPTDKTNHLTNTKVNTGNNRSFGTFSQEEVKRARFAFFGTAFDPNLRYWMELDGSTRGLAGLNNVGLPAAGALPGTAGNGAVTVDHAVRLFSAYVAYDFHPTASEKGCGPECAEGTYAYRPTYTAIFGKFKPFFSYEEVMGSGNQQFVEYGMSEWFFDADDDNLLMGAGTQIKALDDRLYVQAIITNGNETQIANLQMDDYPGFNVGGWYDFGGTFNRQRGRWDLYGDCISDVDYSCNPVLRVGAAANIVPMDRRGIFGNAEQNRVRALRAGPGGTSFGNLITGGALGAARSIDSFDSYSYEAFITGKYRGFSFLNDWWVRDLNNFHAPASDPFNRIVYNVGGVTGNFLFPNHPIIDYGTMLQGGYFIVPKKLEVAARWSWIRGESGDVFGNGKTAHVFVIGGTPVRELENAFKNRHEADEYAIGVNYYFKRQQLKWQTDFSIYDGGNPAAGGQSPAGFIPGVDGWMIRTQIQLWF